MGIPDIETEQKAHEAFDALRRASLKQNMDTNEVVSLLPEIRRNYMRSSEAWRLWCEGNDRCFSDQDILPEVRLTAEAYLAVHPLDPHVLQTMAYIEDEEHIQSFLNKYSTVFDTLQRTLLYTRYLRRNDKEKLEPERQYRFFNAVATLLQPSVLKGLESDDKNENAAVKFQIRLLDIIRDNGNDNIPDCWVDDRLTLGIQDASISLRNGQTEEAIDKLNAVASLLEETMKITQLQKLGTSCRWLDKMIWNAEETWFRKSNNPDEHEERAVYINTSMDGMTTCYLIFPSTYYNQITNMKGKEVLQTHPGFQTVVDRVKAFIVKRP